MSEASDPSFDEVLQRHKCVKAGTIALTYGPNALNWGEVRRPHLYVGAPTDCTGLMFDDFVAVSRPNGSAHHIASSAAWHVSAVGNLGGMHEYPLTLMAS